MKCNPMKPYKRGDKWAVSTLLDDGTAATIAKNGNVSLFDTLERSPSTRG